MNENAPQALDLSNLQKSLVAAAPHLDFALWQAPLSRAFSKFEINTSRRMAAAMGQFLVEAGPELSNRIESLNYTSPTRLVQIFPHEIPTIEAAETYVSHPEALANLVYANHNGNGDAASGDGYLFRGRGLIQVTGRTAYTQLAAALGMDLNELPAYCETPEGAAMSGAWWLTAHGFLPLADSWEIASITRLVNGPALTNAVERLRLSNLLLERLTDAEKYNL